MKLNLPEDFLDMINCLHSNKVNYIIVGGYAMAISGFIRATGDIDIFVEPTVDNSKNVYMALVEFGAPLNSIEENDFSTEGIVYQMGVPPLRIDIITKVDGITFKEACKDALIEKISGISVPFLSLDKLITNKETTGRNKDKIDAIELKKIKGNNND